MTTLSTPNSHEAIQPKRILMISAAFPPIAASGVRRTAKFAKYLGRFDFEPIIWASDRTDGVMIDKLSGEDLPHDLQVHYGGDQKIGGLRNLFRRKPPLIPWPLDRRETRALKHNPYIDWAQASLDALAHGCPIRRSTSFIRTPRYPSTTWSPTHSTERWTSPGSRICNPRIKATEQARPWSNSSSTDSND